VITIKRLNSSLLSIYLIVFKVKLKCEVKKNMHLTGENLEPYKPTENQIQIDNNGRNKPSAIHFTHNLIAFLFFYFPMRHNYQPITEGGDQS